MREVLLNRHFVELFGLAFDDLKGSGGAFPNAGPQTVAQVVRYDACFVVDNGKRAFRTARDALAAAVTEIFVDLNDFAHNFHRCVPRS